MNMKPNLTYLNHNTEVQRLSMWKCVKFCNSYYFSKEHKTLRYKEHRAKPAKTKFVCREHKWNPINYTTFCYSIYCNLLRAYPH